MRRAWILLSGIALACGQTGTDVPQDTEDTEDTDAGANVDADRDGAPASRDCDDSDPENYPGNLEICDAADNDCDGKVDDEDSSLDTSTLVQWFRDADEDGFGDVELPPACSRPARSSDVSGDCDDTRKKVFPGADEICDGLDNDCDTLFDDDDDVATSARRTWYFDDDGDGFGIDVGAFEACDGGEGAVGASGDCDDDNPNISPGAPELCNDGIDDDCDGLKDAADPDLDPASTFLVYRDVDGDGYGAGAGRQVCFVAANEVTLAGDCNDAEPAISPAALERCDTIDNDCDREIDEADAWWNTDWPYRVPVTVRVPTGSPVPGLPILIDADLALALDEAGDGSGLDATSLRVVLQSCPEEQPTLPAEWVDEARGLLGSEPWDDPTGDGRGTLAVRWDDDENTATADAPTPGATLNLAIYFGSTTNTPDVRPLVPPTSLVARLNRSNVVLENGLSAVELSAARGGLALTLGTPGRPSVGTQTTSSVGNGIQFADNGSGVSEWALVRNATNVDVRIVRAGPVVAWARSSGDVEGTYGAFSYTYDWAMFEGRPEVYARVTYELTENARIGAGSPTWTASVRPFFVSNTALLDAGANEGSGDDVGFRWARATYEALSSPYGVFAGWREGPRTLGRPVYDATGTASAGRYVGLVGQDRLALATTPTYDARSGDVIVDGATFVVMPYTGTHASVIGEAISLLSTPVITVLPVQQQP